MKIRLGLQTLLLSASALSMGCGSGGTPPGQNPGQPQPASINCGTLTDSSFAGFLPQEKALIIAENNDLIKAQQQNNEPLSCFFDPKAQFVTDPFDPSLPAGDYLWYTGTPNTGAEHRFLGNFNKSGIMQTVKTADPTSLINYSFDTRGFFASNGVITSQAISSSDLPNLNAYGHSSYSPGTAENYKILQDVASVNHLPAYNTLYRTENDFADGIFFEDPNYGGANPTNVTTTKADIIAGLTIVKKTINRFGIGNDWDVNSFALTTDSLSDQVGKRFLIYIDPNDWNLPGNVFIRSDENMSDNSGNIEGVGAFLWDGPSTDNYSISFLAELHPVTMLYNGAPQWGTAGAQAQSWVNTIASFGVNASSNPIGAIFPCDPCTDLASPLFRMSAGATVNQLNQKLLMAPPAVKGLLPAQATGVLTPQN